MELFSGRVNNLVVSWTPSEGSQSTYPLAGGDFKITTCTIYDATMTLLPDGGEAFALPLNLLVRITKNLVVPTEVTAEHHRNGYYSYYMNEGECGELTFHSTVPADRPAQEIAAPFRALDFVLSQFSLFREISPNNINGNHPDFQSGKKPNIVARGFEGAGVVLRKGLLSGGKATGSAIRYLGKKYTNHVVKSQQNAASNQTQLHLPSVEAGAAQNYAPTDPALVEKAERQRAQAESFHAGARTITSAALYPVRWFGKKASTMATNKNEANNSKTKRAVLDTMGGIGNGAAHVFKGLTEALSEIGDAVGDAAMHHATTVHGEEYAQTVTKQYVNAAGEVGLAGYKVGNVASFGVAGVMVDAMIEGTALAISLYEFLVGPVLLQAYMPMVMLPRTIPKVYFVVLR
jgi:Senescence-associated protein